MLGNKYTKYIEIYFNLDSQRVKAFRSFSAQYAQ